MPGTRVTCTDIDTGDTETTVIEDDYVLICDGRARLAGEQRHANGTTVLTVKVDRSAERAS